MKHRLPTSLLLLLAAFPLFAEDPPGDKPEEPKPDTPKPKTHKVAPGLFKISFEADGVFASSGTREISIDTQSWGVLTVLEAQPHGALVKKGDTLVKLDLEKIEQKLRELRFGLEVSTLDLQVAEAELKLLESTSPMELAALERSNQRVQEDLELFLKTQLPHQKQSAEVSLKGAKDALAYAEEELNQLRKMYEADDLTEETEEIILKRAQASVDRAKFALKGAELRKSETFRHTLPRKTLDIEESARRSELSLQATRKTQPVALVKKRIEVHKLKLKHEQDRENQKRLQSDLRKMQVSAPIAGTLYRGTIEKGKWSGSAGTDPKLRKGGTLKPNEVFMTIVPANGQLHLNASVPEKHFKYLAKGLKAKVRPTLESDTHLEGTVSEVTQAPVAPGQRGVRFDIRLPRDTPLRTGMTANITFVPVEKDNAIWVPSSALTPGDEPDTATVHIYRKDRKPRRQKVLTGHRHDNKVEVLQGIKRGAEVLLEAPSK